MSILKLSLAISSLLTLSYADVKQLDGTWMLDDDGSIIKIEKGIATFTYLTPTLHDDFGFRPGDLSFRAEPVGGNTFKGTKYLKFPVWMWEKCPEKKEIEGTLEMTLSEDGETLEGKWQRSFLDVEDCSIKTPSDAFVNFNYMKLEDE